MAITEQCECAAPSRTIRGLVWKNFDNPVCWCLVWISRKGKTTFLLKYELFMIESSKLSMTFLHWYVAAGVHSHDPSIRSHRGKEVVRPDFQPMRVPEEPFCIHFFRQNPVFTSLHLKSPVHVVPPRNREH